MTSSLSDKDALSSNVVDTNVVDTNVVRTRARIERTSTISLTVGWHTDAPAEQLTIFEDAHGHGFAVARTSTESETLVERVERGDLLAASELSERLKVPWLDATAPLPLVPVSVPKAWGREIWFTGIEERGVVGVGTASAQVPLPWVMAARRGHFGSVAAPVLVKVLAPSSSADTGDLYFEVHEHKEEVYVVAAVDQACWPDRCGRMRYGFDPAQRKRLGDTGFRMAFATAAQANARAQRALAASGARGPAHDEARATVRRTRDRLQGFVNDRVLEVGEVVRVPPGLPHGLMHGVRAVEIQTPSYERDVLYAAQPLAPTDSLPILERLEQVRMDVPDDAPAKEASPAPGVRTGRIARMSDFDVHRFALDAGAVATLPTASYGVLLCMHGHVRCGGLELGPEQAALCSERALARRVEAGDASAVVLLTLPR